MLARPTVRAMNMAKEQTMHNVLAIFKRDMLALKTNVIAAIVAIGLVLVPPMYAWLTTLGFWDPYSNTADIKVAVANNDVGYSSSLIPTQINAGDQIISALHDNDSFDWVFLDESEAVNGAYSGQYYAAIVIPENFTADLMTVFSDKATKAEIKYYSNEKENAIAPRVTEAGATALQNEIDQTFTKTVANIALSTTSSLADFLNGDSITNYATLLLDELDNAISDIGAARSEIQGLSAMVGNSAQLIQGSGFILGNTKDATGTANTLLSDAASSLSSADEALGGITDEVNSAISATTSGYDSLADAIDAAFDSASQDPATMQQLLSDISNSISTTKGDYEQLRDRLQASGVTGNAIDAIDDAIGALGRLKDAVNAADDDIGQMSSAAQEARSKIDSELESAKQSITEMNSTLEEALKQQTETLKSDLSALESSASDLSGKIDAISGNLSSTASDLASNMNALHASLDDTQNVLGEISDSMTATRNDLFAAMSTGDIDEIRKIVGNNPEAIAAFLSAPTMLDKHPIYEMKSNGDTMSAFYSSLSLWIGAIFLVALTDVNPSRRRLAGLKDVKAYQTYLGRYGVFGFIAIMQGIVLCIGNVFFVGVQCQHFWLYLLACVFCAIVFSCLVYTLTACFGNIGKAIAIIGLVMQLGGSGGIFPIQMSAPFFQAIYPWLPFAHSMEAFEGCIAGIYGMQYWISMLCLAAFLGVALVFGVVLRRPLAKLNGYILEKMDETKLL